MSATTRSIPACALVGLLTALGSCSDKSTAVPTGDQNVQPNGAAGAAPDGDQGQQPNGAAGAAPDRDEDQQPSSSAAGAASPAGPTDPRSESGPALDPADPQTPLSDIPPSCRGFDVLGLTHSPGGSVLPNTCAPFHGTLNNPYAIRCRDADPSYRTEWPGDELCILPPEANKGTQIYVGPPSYQSPSEEWVMEPGLELNEFYRLKSSNDEPHYYYRGNWRARAGAHHIVVNAVEDDFPDGWTSPSSAFDVGGESAGLGNVGGAQRVDADRPQGTLEIPQENEGIGALLEAHQQITVNMHSMNQWEKPILREAWINLWYMDESEVEKPLQGVWIVGNPADVSIPPGARTKLHYACNATGDTRIITLIGHRHAWTDRFGIWVRRASGEELSVYESFDYNDMPVYQYDSISKNPMSNVDGKIDGAYSGLLELARGDQLHFVCDINNRSDVTLKFANEVLTGEMCVVFGSLTGDQLCNGVVTRIAD